MTGEWARGRKGTFNKEGTVTSHINGGGVSTAGGEKLALANYRTSQNHPNHPRFGSRDLLIFKEEENWVLVTENDSSITW